MATLRTGFRPSLHGFAFANTYPRGLPVVCVPTPFGPLGLGDAAGGLCGGMAFAALDYFLHGRPLPAALTPDLFRYFCRRLLASWNLPFGVLRYYDWQCRPDVSRMLAGECVLAGVSRLTITEEWPKVRAQLDAGLPAPLGLVNVHGYDPRMLPRHHQVLAYGYDLTDSELTLGVYDPNWPLDDDVALKLDLGDPEAGTPIAHTCEGRIVRGFFLTEYRKNTPPV